jgi:hypothetical protein
MIHQNDVSGVVLGDRTNLVGFATAHEKARIRPLAATRDGRHRLSPGRNGQLPELMQILGIDMRANAHAHEDRALTAPWALEHSGCP